MQLYSESKNYKLYQGNMLDMLDVLDLNSVDSIVTDPPYELGFMGKSWDSSGIAFQRTTWEKCYKVLKPGGYLLAFGGTRTYHRIACAIEDAGFEIRDCIIWLYGSGFPKSLNIGLAIDKRNGVESKVVGEGKSGVSSRAYQSEETTTAGAYDIKEAQNEWSGWGTALKPAYEPIIVARKPVDGSIVENVIRWGVGGMNIDECRVGDEEISTHKAPKGTFAGGERDRGSDTSSYETHLGRFPSNVIHDGSEEATKDMPQTGSGNGGEPYNYAGKEYNNKDTSMFNGDKPIANSNYNDSGSASRYFYCAKASKKDRDDGLEEFESKVKVFNGQSSESSKDIKDVEQRFTTIGKNVHPTVKPTDLMQYLIRLVTPNGGTILDPFNGSGSTGKAAMYENAEKHKEYKYIGIELTEEYLPISKARIEYAERYDPSASDREPPKKDLETIEKKSGLTYFNLFDNI